TAVDRYGAARRGEGSGVVSGRTGAADTRRAADDTDPDQGNSATEARRRSAADRRLFDSTAFDLRSDRLYALLCRGGELFCCPPVHAGGSVGRGDASVAGGASGDVRRNARRDPESRNADERG